MAKLTEVRLKALRAVASGEVLIMPKRNGDWFWICKGEAPSKRTLDWLNDNRFIYAELSYAGTRAEITELGRSALE